MAPSKNTSTSTPPPPPYKLPEKSMADGSGDSCLDKQPLGASDSKDDHSTDDRPLSHSESNSTRRILHRFPSALSWLLRGLDKLRARLEKMQLKLEKMQLKLEKMQLKLETDASGGKLMEVWETLGVVQAEYPWMVEATFSSPTSTSAGGRWDGVAFLLVNDLSRQLLLDIKMKKTSHIQISLIDEDEPTIARLSAGVQPGPVRSHWACFMVLACKDRAWMEKIDRFEVISHATLDGLRVYKAGADTPFTVGDLPDDPTQAEVIYETESAQSKAGMCDEKYKKGYKSVIEAIQSQSVLESLFGKGTE